MFVLKTAQIQHFIAADENELVHVIAKAIRTAIGPRVAVYDDNKLGSMVKIGIVRARSHGLTRAEDLAAFIAVMFEVAPRFDEQPEINGFLTNAQFSPEVRFSQLFEGVPEESWQAAQKNYDDSFWFTA